MASGRASSQVMTLGWTARLAECPACRGGGREAESLSALRLARRGNRFALSSPWPCQAQRNGAGSNTGAGYPQGNDGVMITSPPSCVQAHPPGPSNLTLSLSDHRYINIRYIFDILAALTLAVHGQLRIPLYAQGYGSCFPR